jgi:hypothetical protein
MSKHKQSQTLHERLDQAPVPAHLHQTLMTDLAVQDTGHKHWPGLAIAATIVVMLMSGWLLRPAATPPLIRAAQAHAQEEAGLLGERNPSLRPWLQAKVLGSLPAGYRVEMSKVCEIGALRARHLRLVTPDAGTLELMIPMQDQYGGQAIATGSGDDWLIVRPRAGLTVIALLEAAGDKDAATRLIRRLFTASPVHLSPTPV